MTGILGVIVLHKEAERAAPALANMRRLCRRLVVLHDGECDDATKAVAERYADELIEREWKGCKEPHLVWFFGTQTGDWSWYLHHDADEVFDERALRQVESTDLSVPGVYSVELVHTDKNGRTLALRPGRETKVVLFHRECFQSMTGLTHGTPRFDRSPQLLEGCATHDAPHAFMTLLERLRRELKFTVVDARLRTSLVGLYHDGVHEQVPPSSPALRRADRWIYQYPLLMLLPAVGYGAALVFRGAVMNSRSPSALLAELRRVVVVAVYRARLCWLVRRHKSSVGRC